MTDKVSLEHVADVKISSSPGVEKAEVSNNDQVALETRIRHKLDWRVLPLGTLIYLFAQIDRSNMSNAVVLGESEC
jgi:hypothetical protein